MSYFNIIKSLVKIKECLKIKNYNSIFDILDNFINTQVNCLLLYYSRYMLIINPSLDINIHSQFVKSTNPQENIFQFESRIIIMNPLIYFKNLEFINLTAMVNFLPVKEIILNNIKDNYFVIDLSLPYQKKRLHQIEESTISYSFSFIYGEIYKFIFYDHRFQQNI
jgi:hypothetical protein